MARYFFDIFDADGVRRDEIGIDCASRDEAREHAVRALPQITLDHHLSDERRIVAIQIRDADGTYIFRTSLTFLAHWLAPAGF
ncbi:hypothetical protein PY365_03085 [Roseiarcaceae bacterium H3SJ34-1]|uniref:DUF6894 family protein n=1 Tax=Terripilifer ovatus TaxID=3032367 RepID=UPI003AB9B10F|nr:hypothetical protein [Roseiarcaceae bacterium H3SJ34-1]